MVLSAASTGRAEALCRPWAGLTTMCWPLGWASMSLLPGRCLPTRLKHRQASLMPPPLDASCTHRPLFWRSRPLPIEWMVAVGLGGGWQHCLRHDPSHGVECCARVCLLACLLSAGDENGVLLLAC